MEEEFDLAENPETVLCDLPNWQREAPVHAYGASCFRSVRNPESIA